ncbi:MAG: RNA-binding S4 domain-containing protein [Campylobacterales bacterium]
MRVDKFLNSTNIVKRRAIAQDMIEHKVVFVNGVVAKSSKDIKVGDEIEIKFLEETKKYQVLQIPTVKNIPKHQKDEYVKEL